MSSKYFDDVDFCESEYIGNILLHLKDFLGSSFSEFEFIIYSQTPQYTKPIYLFGKTKRKEVVFYLSDESSSIPHDVIKAGVFAVFKNYLPSQTIYSNLFHLPLGYVNTTISQPVKLLSERNTNVFFSGALHFARLALYQHFTPFRFLPLKAWQRLYKFLYSDTEFDTYFPNSFIRFNKQGFKSGLGSESYSDLLYDSKIVICPRGVISYETFRHFEALRAGCIIISEPLPDTFFYANSPMIILPNWRELDTIVKQLLASPEKQALLQAKTIEWWNNVCSETAIAQRIVNMLSSLK